MLQKSYGVDNLWQRFVTVHQEDQDLLTQEAKKWKFRPIISNYQGNPQAVITHPKGAAKEFTRQARTAALHAFVHAQGYLVVVHPGA